jgi:soluble cytochrome b562
LSWSGFYRWPAIGTATQRPGAKGVLAGTCNDVAEARQKARTLAPPTADKLTGDEKAKILTTFQRGVDALLKEIAILKDAIANDKLDAAKASFQKIKDLKESNHKALGVESETAGRRHGALPSGQ